MSPEATIDWCQTQIRSVSLSLFIYGTILETRLQKDILLEHG